MRLFVLNSVKHYMVNPTTLLPCAYYLAWVDSSFSSNKTRGALQSDHKKELSCPDLEPVAGKKAQ